MSEGVRVDLGPPPVEGFDPKSMVGQTVTIERGGPEGGKVVDAWIHEDVERGPRLVAMITVDDELARKLFQPPYSIEGFDVLDEHAVRRTLIAHRPPEPVKLTALAEFEHLYGRTAEVVARHIEHVRENNPEPAEGLPVYTVNRYGGKHSIVRVYRGGFRSRYLVQWARGLWMLVRMTPEWIGAILRDTVFPNIEQADRQRACPHPAHVREPLGNDMPYDTCRWCNEVFPH